LCRKPSLRERRADRERAQALVERIVASVDSLNEVMEAVNKELRELDRHRVTINFANEVWTGYNKRLAICFENVVATQR
jgi:hypothetical protein